jgi:hypothetical protein
MRKHLLVACLSACALLGCRRATPERQLRDSFIQQIASLSIVRDFQRSGDEVTFSARYAEKPDAKYRVRIDSTAIEPAADGKTPYTGVVKSSWYINGEPVRPRGAYSDLPLPFLDNGLAQECWAFWEDESKQWSWK